MNLAPDPMQAFQMGQARAKANSPITGIGLAIQNIVDDARKKGLLQAQSLYQAQGTNVSNILKEERAATRPKTTKIVSPESGEVINTITGTGDEDVKIAPAADPFKQLMADMFGSSLKKNATSDTGIQDIVPGADASLDVKASEFLKANGKPDTPANRAAVIEKGLVK